MIRQGYNMATQYTQRLTLSVPEALVPQANQLALIVGESAADANTFAQANWQDEQGNLYAVCSTVAKPVVTSLLGTTLKADNLPPHAEGADLAAAQQAMDAIVVYQPYNEQTPATQADPTHIVLAIDYAPIAALKQMGLTQVPTNEEI